MAEIIVQQSSLFLISVLYGVILGLWYDFFRAVRRKISHRNRTVHMEDIVFCLSAAAGLFLLFQIYNQGSIRFYVLLGLFAGAMGYFFLLSALMGKGMELLVGAAVFFLKKAAKGFKKIDYITISKEESIVISNQKQQENRKRPFTIRKTSR